MEYWILELSEDYRLNKDTEEYFIGFDGVKGAFSHNENEAVRFSRKSDAAALLTDGMLFDNPVSFVKVIVRNEP